jgi:hypothetical protein
MTGKRCLSVAAASGHQKKRNPNMFVIRLIRRTDGTPTDYDRKYLVDFDLPLLDENGEEDPFAHLIVVDQPADARHFDSESEAWNFWLDKPLQAFSINLIDTDELAEPKLPNEA